MTVQETAGRSHFALIVIAKSATTIEGLLSSCAAEPFLASLRMRCTGIASFDDREEGDGLADITTSSDGSWRSERELIDALHQRCEELPRYFAARGKPGMTRTEMAALRQAQSESALGEAQPEPAADGDALDGTSAASPDARPVPDILDAPGAAGRIPPRLQLRLTMPTPDPPDLRPGPCRPQPSPVADRYPLLRGEQAAGVGDQDLAPAQPPRTAIGLAYLLMVLDQDAAADPALARLQAALLDVGRRIAAQSAVNTGSVMSTVTRSTSAAIRGPRANPVGR